MTAFSIMPRQRDALEFIVRYIAAQGIAPSYEDIRVALDLKSKAGVGRLVDGLVQRGLLMRLGRAPRSITLVTEPGCALPPHVHARLTLYCTTYGERFEDVLADAVDLFLEQRDADLVRERAIEAETIAAGGGVTDDAA